MLLSQKLYICIHYYVIGKYFFRKPNKNQNQTSPHPSHKPLFTWLNNGIFTNTMNIYQVTSLQQYEYT